MMKKVLSVLFAIVFFVSTHSYVNGQQMTGKQIVQKMLDANKGINSVKNKITMILKSSTGIVQKREIDAVSLSAQSDVNKTLLRFVSPPDVKGTAFLSHTNGNSSSSNQWIYLPSTKRVKRISSNTDNGSAFMSSEFTYEDLNPRNIEDATYKYLGDKVFNGKKCHVVKSTPKTTANSQYKYTITLFNPNANYRIEAVIFYDKTGRKLKTLTQTDYKKYLGKYFLPGKMFMYNNQTKKTTTLLTNQVQLNVSVKESEVSLSAIKS